MYTFRTLRLYIAITLMIRKIKVTDYPRLIEIWESAVLSTHDFLKEEDFLYYKEQLPVYFQYVTLFGFEQEGILIGFMGIAEGNLEMLFITNKQTDILKMKIKSK